MLTGALKHPIDFGSANAKKKKLILGSSDKCDIQIFGTEFFFKYLMY